MKVFTEVTVGGPLSNNKGINNRRWPVGRSADRKDKADIVTAAKIGVDYRRSPSRVPVKT